MPIAALFIVIAGAVAVAILYPHLRILALAMLVLFGGVLGAYFLTGNGTVERQAALIPAEELVVSDVDLTAGVRFETLTGRVTNPSDSYRLRSFDVTVTLHDCPDALVPLETCATIAQDRGTARVDVPPGQTRAFRAVVGFAAVPPLQGVLRWDYRISATTATP